MNLLVCRSCGGVLTASLAPLSEGRTLRVHDGSPLIPTGHLVVSDGSVFTRSEGQYLVDGEDARNLTPKPIPGRDNGCCGLDGLDGPNRTCLCGAEVATQKSDCWMPHALLFDPEKVEVVEASAE